MAFSNYGEAFAGNVLRKYYSNALTPAFCNTDYEGEIKKIGDRVNVLMFLEDITLTDYAVGTDMATQSPVDTEAYLHINKKKYYNFSIDAVDKALTYANDPDSALVENAAKALIREIDRYTLDLAAEGVKADNWVGIDHYVEGDGADTCVSISTTATGGTLTAGFGPATSEDGSCENVNGDGNSNSSTLYRIGFGSDVVGRAIRIMSGTSYYSDWYRITGATDSNNVTIENWDSNVQTSSHPYAPAGDILYGLHGAIELLAGSNFGDDSMGKTNGTGYQIKAAIPTTVTSSNIYACITELSATLDKQGIPRDGRYLIAPAQFISLLKQSSNVNPAIEMAYNEIVKNGNVGRVDGFEILMAADGLISTRAGRSTATGQGSDTAVTTGANGYQVIACHKSFMTFAHKWSESRVKDSELQFAKLYQGLNLYGAKVLNLRRKAGAGLFCTF